MPRGKWRIHVYQSVIGLIENFLQGPISLDVFNWILLIFKLTVYTIH
jgi:hypothetical protein